MKIVEVISENKKIDLPKEDNLKLYYYMLLNREFDDRIAKFYKQGKVIGAAYGSRGQEATSVGSAYALKKEDVIGPMIRNAGAILVRGLSPKNFLANFVGREATPTRGKDGNSHLGSLDLGIIAPISHLGSLIPALAGCALAFKMRSEKRVALTWIGDGGSSTTDFHEGLNIAAVMKLPFVLIIENNQYAYSTPIRQQTLVQDFAIKSKGYGVEGIIVDGNDVIAVYQVTKYAVEKARDGGGPTLIESKTMRMKGHAEHDDAFYVPKELFEEWRKKDPIERFEKYLLENKLITQTDNENIKKQVVSEIDSAEKFVFENSLPESRDTRYDVYANND